MIIELNTNLLPIFSGTYETMWEVNECMQQGEEVQVNYDFSEFMQSIMEAYEANKSMIVSEMGIPFIKSIHFTGTHSPKQYNFSTDTLDFDCEIDETLLLNELSSLASDTNFNTWLHDNFTSYDGFWSYTPNNYQDLYTAITTNNNEYIQAIGALCTYIMEKNFKSRNVENTIEMSIWENWQGNGYYGLNYTTVCWECNKPIDYDHDFECQNVDCERFKKVELINPDQTNIDL